MVNRSVLLVVLCWLVGVTSLVIMVSNWIYLLCHLNVHYDPHHPPHWHSTGYNYFYLTGTSYSSYLVSHFSYQVGLVVILALLAGPFLPPRRFCYILMTGLTSYASVLVILFNSMLLTLKLHAISAATYAPLSRFDWLTMIWLHAVLPGCFLIYALFCYNPLIKVNTKRFFTRQLGWLVIYPLLYFGIIIMRGELMIVDLKRTTGSFHWINLVGQNRDELFNYFFFNFGGQTLGLPNWEWMIFVLTIGSLIGLGMVWVFVRVHNLLFDLGHERRNINQLIS